MKIVSLIEHWWTLGINNVYLFYGIIVLLAFLIVLILMIFHKKKIVNKFNNYLTRNSVKVIQSLHDESKRDSTVVSVVKELERPNKPIADVDPLLESRETSVPKKVNKSKTKKLSEENEEINIENINLKSVKQPVDKEHINILPAEQEPIIQENTKKANGSNLNEIKTEKRITNTVFNESATVVIIESLPDPGRSSPKRIGYLPNDNFKQGDPCNYPIVRMPLKNSLIKFPRKGRSDKKGYKEDDFFKQITPFFTEQFEIINDRHIPTENGRPYEPDLILINEKEGKNIFINIEIDEPYDGWMRTPTHCIGDNNLRDDFFTKRGWLVIRFAEIQVHTEPESCFAYIAKVVSSIDPYFKSTLLEKNGPTPTIQWDSLKAKKWAAEKYRERYLGILTFGIRPNVITEYVIEPSILDKEVESEIPKFKSVVQEKEGSLSIKFKDERDKRITFDPVEHRYYIDGNPDTISVTQLIDKFFPEFDAPYWSQMKASEKGISPLELLIEWEEKGKTAANKGTKLHKEIENYYNLISFNADTPEFKQFLDFTKIHSSLIPYRSEWRIFDEDLLIAGTADMVFKKQDGSLHLFDWKRSEKVVYNDGTIMNKTYKYGFGELGHLGENSYNKYCLQQNIYKSILEKRYGVKIESMNLLIMHESYNNFFLKEIHDMQKEASYILSYSLSIT